MNIKDSYVEKVQTKLEEYSSNINELKAMIKSEVANLNIDTYQRLYKLEENLKAAKLRLSNITNTADDTWLGLSGRLETLLDEIGESIKRLSIGHK